MKNAILIWVSKLFTEPKILAGLGAEDMKKVVKKVLKLTPHALGALVVAAHASEFTRIVSHAGVPELLLASVILFAWMFTRGNSEEI